MDKGSVVKRVDTWQTQNGNQNDKTVTAKGWILIRELFEGIKNDKQFRRLSNAIDSEDIQNSQSEAKDNFEEIAEVPDISDLVRRIKLKKNMIK